MVKYYYLLTAAASAKAKFVNPLVAGRAPLAILDLPGVLAIHLVVGIYLHRHSLIIVLALDGLLFFASCARHHLNLVQSLLLILLPWQPEWKRKLMPIGQGIRSVSESDWQRADCHSFCCGRYFHAVWDATPVTGDIRCYLLCFLAFDLIISSARSAASFLGSWIMNVFCELVYVCISGARAIRPLSASASKNSIMSFA
jgi:hypothetical protein